MSRSRHSSCARPVRLPPAPAAPVLIYDQIEGLVWTWGGADPYAWWFESSEDGETGWGVGEQVSGDARSLSPENPGYWYRMYGVSESSAVITATSEAVIVDL